MVTLREMELSLEQEVHYFRQGATAYRRRTAELALQAIHLTDNPLLFSTRQSAFQFVSRTFLTETEERKEDIAKALHLAYALCRREQKSSSHLQKKVGGAKGN